VKGALAKYRNIAIPSTTWDPLNKGPLITLSNANLDATNSDGSASWNSVGAVKSRNTGKFKFEAKLIGNTPTSSLLFLGVCTVSNPMNTFLGNNSTGWGIQNLYDTGVGYRYYHNGSFTNVSAGNPADFLWLFGQSVMVACDLDAGNHWVKKSDATDFMGGGDPDLGTSPTFTLAGATLLIPASGINLIGPGTTFRINSGGPFATSGANTFLPWGT